MRGNGAFLKIWCLKCSPKQAGEFISLLRMCSHRVHVDICGLVCMCLLLLSPLLRMFKEHFFEHFRPTCTHVGLKSTYLWNFVHKSGRTCTRLHSTFFFLQKNTNILQSFQNYWKTNCQGSFCFGSIDQLYLSLMCWDSSHWLLLAAVAADQKVRSLHINQQTIFHCFRQWSTWF